MRTSLNEIKLIDSHLNGQLYGGESALFNAMLILNPALPEQITWQRKTRTTIEQYSRKALRQEIDNVYTKLFTEPAHSGFRQRILKIFG
jgi:hypothetical protein